MATIADHLSVADIDAALWETHWHLLCHRSEIAVSGAFVRFTIGREEVVAHNDGASVVVFDNRCPHRGAQIFDGHCGVQRFVCKYHGWSLIKGKFYVPQRETFDEGTLDDIALDRYSVGWIGDFLFASRRPGKGLEAQFEGLVSVISEISFSISGQRDVNAYTYPSNWRLATENALDQYHVALLHASTLNKLALKQGRETFYDSNNTSIAPIDDARIMRRMKAIRRMFDIQFESDAYFSLYMFPFTFITSTFGYSYSLQQFYPHKDVEKCNFSSRFYTGKLRQDVDANIMDSFFASAIELNHEVFAEDSTICARLPFDSWSRSAHKHVSFGETRVVRFRESMEAFERRAKAAQSPGEEQWQSTDS
jgi:phenylpropionate dioxygenase-like ring-hydroxylating dioxygenase large terminal subunit